MNTNEAYRILDRDVAPLVQAGDEPEDALIKVASKHRLNATQLVKLGQLFNTAVSIATVKNASMRDKTPRTVDTRVLKERFETHTGKGKTTVKKASAPEIVVHARFPRKTAPVEETVKVASAAEATVPPVEEAADMAETFKAASKQELRDMIRETDDMIGEACFGLRSAIKYAFDKITAKPRLLPEMLADMRHAGVPDESVELLVKSASALQTVHKDKRWTVPALADLPAEIRSFPVDRHDMVKMAQAVDHFTAQTGDLIRVRSLLSDTLAEKPSSVKAASDTAHERELDQDRKRQEQERGGKKENFNDSPTFRPRGRQGLPVRSVEDRTRQLLQEENRQARAGMSMSELVGQMSQGLDRSAEVIPDDVTLTTRLMNLMAESPYEVQKARDEASTETSQVAMLTRLLATDPVISRMPVDKVMASYNTLRAQGSPALNDPAYMAAILREASQYNGVPLHTLSDLAKTRESVLKGNALQQQAAASRYGAASLPRDKN